MGDSLPWTPVNRRAEFDTSSLILRREFHNCANKKTQTVTDTLHVNNNKCPNAFVRHVQWTGTFVSNNR